MTTPGTSLHYRALGPLSVCRDGRPLELGGPRQKSVLAILLMARGAPVTTEQLIDGLWGENPPVTAVATLHAYISNLRRILDPTRPARSQDGVLGRMAGGYVLRTGGALVDLDDFETEARRGLAGGMTPEAHDSLTDALAAWRGPAFTDFLYEEFAQPEINRLEQLRVDVAERRIAIDLALGRQDGLISEIERLISDHPMREQLWAHLMLALYRADRQTEALSAYRRYERMMAELGLVPGRALRELEMMILDHDDRLLAPPATGELLPAKEGQAVGGQLDLARVPEGAHGRVLTVDSQPTISTRGVSAPKHLDAGITPPPPLGEAPPRSVRARRSPTGDRVRRQHVTSVPAAVLTTLGALITLLGLFGSTDQASVAIGLVAVVVAGLIELAARRLSQRDEDH